MNELFLIEISLTHDHWRGVRLPGYFQALAVPLDGDGEPTWEWAEPATPPVLYGIVEDVGFDAFLERTAEALGDLAEPPTADNSRIEFSVEGPEDCCICSALAETDLRSQGRLV